LQAANDKVFAGKEFLVGSSLTIADIYAYIVLSWTPFVGLSLDAFPNVAAFYERVRSLPVIQEAHARIATDPTTTF